MSFFLVIKAEIVRSMIVMRRYWFRTLTGMVMGYGMLLVLITGFMVSRDEVTKAATSGFGDAEQATKFVLGFIIGMFAFGIVGMFTQGLQGMASTGVLEQLCLSPHGLVTNFLARSTVAAVTSVLSSALMVWLVTVTVGGTLYFDPPAVIALMVLTFINLIGFGFMMGGLVLVFKQVGQIAILIRMGLFALAIYAKDDLLERGWAMAAFVHALPIADASILLKWALISNQGIVGDNYDNYQSVFVHPSMKFLIISCVVWTLLGITLFKSMETWSRSKGTLGGY
ncbi:MAG: ABC transporter permease [Candidatus Hydrogenedentes bacterium]|nr:ABC transporter permease [Candidatus Hydrogenedentota bacterium]